MRICSLDTGSDPVGSPKYGDSTHYTAKAQVALSVLEVETGRILVTGTGTGSASSSSNSSSLRTTAFTRAVDNAVYTLILNHAKLKY